jgi:hypothetical protein
MSSKIRGFPSQHEIVVMVGFVACAFYGVSLF